MCLLIGWTFDQFSTWLTNVKYQCTDECTEKITKKIKRPIEDLIAKIDSKYTFQLMYKFENAFKVNNKRKTF